VVALQAAPVGEGKANAVGNAEDSAAIKVALQGEPSGHRI